jgi:WD40 repeat protein
MHVRVRLQESRCPGLGRHGRGRYHPNAPVTAWSPFGGFRAVIRRVISVALGVLVASGCRSDGAPAIHPVSVHLTHVWTRVGDAHGAIDEDRGTASVESAEFSPDARWIVSGSKKGWQVIVWDAETGERRWEQKHDEEVEAVAFSPDGRHVASGGEDGRVRIWSAVDGQPIVELEHSGSIDGMRFSPDGRLLAAGDETGRVKLWNTADWSLLYILAQGEDEQAGGPPGIHSDVNSVDFTRDGRFMAVASRNHAVRLWEVSSAEARLVQVLEGHSGSVKTVRFSPDGSLVAAGAAGGSGVRIWARDGTRVQSIPATAWIVEAVEFTPDGRFLFTGGNEGEVEASAEQLAQFPGNAGFGFIRAYDVRRGFELVLEEPAFRQEYLHFTADGRRLVSSHEDGTLRLWNVTTH